MTNRVLLNSSGLKISKPGVNVIGASDANLNFSSDWAQMGLYRHGVFTVSWSGNLTQPLSIALGKTFSTPPLVTYVVTGGSSYYGYRTTIGSSGFSLLYYEDNLDENNGNRYHWLVGRATTTQILIDRGWHEYVSGDPTPPAYSVDYSIWEYNL